MRVKFKPGNQIAYGQDLGFYRGVPDGIWFDATHAFGDQWKLVADGYGVLDKDGAYGCGAIYVSGAPLPSREER